MKRVALAASIVLASSLLHAAPTSPSASSNPSIAPSVAAPIAPSTSVSAALPPGHPSLEGPAIPAGPLPEDDEALPPGHPSVAPDGEPPKQQQPDLPEIPQDDVSADTSIAAGTIHVHIADEKNQPAAHVPVTLGIIHQTVAQGESRTHVVKETNDAGDVVFDELKTGSGYAYRVSVESTSADGRGHAKFSAMPFGMPLDRGYKVLLHRFPVETTIDRLMIAVGGVDTILDVRDDVVEVQQAFDVINAGLVAWSLGDDGLTLDLPKGSKGLRAQDVMQDVRVNSIERTGEDPGVKWEGSIAPGDTQISYDFKIPYEGDPTVDVDLQMPPRVLAARVRLAARRDMSLAVDGFPPATADVAQSGVHVLETTKRGSPQDQIQALHIHIKGLPTQGPARWIVTAAAFVVVAIGLAFALRKDATSTDPRFAAEARARRRRVLIDDMVALERAHRSGEVGPKAYARERAKLVDMLAEALDPVEPEPRKSRKNKDEKASMPAGRRRARDAT